MKIKMLEAFQSTKDFGRLVEEEIVVSIFDKGDVLEVDRPLGDWLVENKKAEEIKPVVYAFQPVPPSPEPFEPESRRDDEIQPVRKPRPGKRSQ
jgi:hypothetical protein